MDTDEEILKQFGGMDTNNLNTVLGSFEDSEDELQTFAHSPYYDLDSLTTTLTTYENNFTILSINIQSIRAKFDRLNAILAHLENFDINFSAICIQETWLADKDDTSLIHIPGYELINQTKRCCGHGGLLIYLQDIYTHTYLNFCNESDLWEDLFIEIKGPNLKSNIILGNIYRPPKFNNNNDTLNRFISEIRPILHKVSQRNCTTIITGDFNINLLSINEREKIQDYLDIFLSNSLYPKITLPTRFSRKAGSLIDQIYCKLADNTVKSVSGILHTDLSDHLPYFTSLDILNKSHKDSNLIKVHTDSPSAREAFFSTIDTAVRETNFDSNLLHDPNINYNKLHEIISEAKDKHLPTKLTKFKKYKHKKSPWMTFGIIKSIKSKDKLYKKLKSTHPDSNDYLALETNLKSYRATLQKSIRTAKSDYYSRKFNKYRSNIKKTWSTIKEIICKKSTSNAFPEYFNVGNSKITDKANIANQFNKYFTNIGPELSQNIKPPPSKNYTDFLTERIASSFSFETITCSETAKVIKSLKPKTSSGHDNLSTVLLKFISPTIAQPLTTIINQSLCTGIFPDLLKIAKVLPFFKKADPHIFDNYRPISLLPTISKVFEKIVYKQIYNYFQTNKLFYIHQYGFRDQHSTELAALELTDRITNHMDNRKIPIAIFLDLSKAFDTLDHSILISKLNYYGIKGPALLWFKSYLSGRRQYVDFDGSASSYLTLTTGVPQGSVLGPLLFLICMNDLHKVTDKFHSILFADDTSLISTICTFDIPHSIRCNNKAISDNINGELNKVYDWLALNKLSLNVSKTKFMLFHHRQLNITSLIPDLRINNQPIDRITNFNFLGLTLDENMTWNCHINKIANKISRTIGILNKLKNILPVHILKIIYTSLIQPHLQYAILCWGHNPKKLIKIQKQAVRKITLSKYNAHSEPLLKQLAFLKVTDIYKASSLKLYYKIRKGTVPYYFRDLLTHQPIQVYNTRDTNVVQLYRPHTKSGENCIKFTLPKLINETRRELLDKIDTHSLFSFTRCVKYDFINLYEMDCTIRNCFICSNTTDNNAP